jgi:hypothetical protein
MNMTLLRKQLQLQGHLRGPFHAPHPHPYDKVARPPLGLRQFPF